MSDFAPRRTPEGPHFTDREGREVVVEHERLRRLLQDIDGVDALLVTARPERHDRERLRAAAGEQRRPVRARQQTDLAGDRADLFRGPAIDALALVEDLPAQRLVFDPVDDAMDLLLVILDLSLEGLRDFERDLLTELGERRVALLLAGQVQRFVDTPRGQLVHSQHQPLIQFGR